MAVNVCAPIDALARFQLDVVRRLNKKFEQLRRLASLLEQLGNLSELVPNIAGLIPVVDIDLSVYNQLAAACPFLNLPAPGEASLNELRAKVIAAYANLARKVLNHPWNRLGALQGELSKLQAQLNAPLATATNFIQCLQAACTAAVQAGTVLGSFSVGQINTEIAKFNEFYVEQAGQVLTGPAETKFNEAQNTFKTLNELGAGVKDDYSFAKAEATRPPTSPEVVVQTTGREYKLQPFAPPPT